MSRDELFSTSPEPKATPAGAMDERALRHQPLAARMRPRDLNEFVGQSHILGPGQLLRRAIEADRIQSLIFYGPPGTGKTSLAQIIARQTRSKFERLSGVESNVADMRRVLSLAANRLESHRLDRHGLGSDGLGVRGLQRAVDSFSHWLLHRRRVGSLCAHRWHTSQLVKSFGVRILK